jgi:hypothetical protein
VTKDIELLDRKLDVLTVIMAAVLDKLAALTAESEPLSMSERIPLLNRLGLDRTQIARVVGTSPEVVSVRLAESRRKASRRSHGPALGRKGDRQD